LFLYVARKEFIENFEFIADGAAVPATSSFACVVDVQSTVLVLPHMPQPVWVTLQLLHTHREKHTQKE